VAPAVPPPAAPSDIYPRNPREAQLCAEAGTPDWLYLFDLVALDAVAIRAGSSPWLKEQVGGPVLRTSTGPVAIGLTWGATLGGAWLALPKCSPTWLGEPPREGAVRSAWPLALSLALLAGATAPVVNAIAVGTLPFDWSTTERSMHVVVAGVAGFVGALVPYVIPPRTWAASRELERLRFDADARGVFVGYTRAF
jgi:hypothetical protein